MFRPSQHTCTRHPCFFLKRARFSAVRVWKSSGSTRDGSDFWGVCTCMCMCVCVCVYVCMHACLHAYMSGCLSVCMYGCMYVNSPGTRRSPKISRPGDSYYCMSILITWIWRKEDALHAETLLQRKQHGDFPLYGGDSPFRWESAWV